MPIAWVPTSILGFAFLFSLTGCVMSNTPMKAPASAGSLPVPAGIDAEAVFSCVESSVRSLHDKNELWNIRVTLRDAGRGVIETGDFDDDNIGGFRVSVQHNLASNDVRMRIKGAGPYFMDLGVDQAFVEFDARMRQCLSSK